MSDNLLFKKVRCKAFLKKVYDGKFIDLDSDGNASYVDKNGEKHVKDYDGSLEFLKTYYERKERNFSGIVVGIKDVKVTGFLWVDTNYDYIGTEHTIIGKHPNEVIKCAIVYYANNRSSLVPLNDLEKE